jgi:hypothetical protein
MSTCVEERRICSDGSPLPTSLLEAEALQLAEWAFARRAALVLVPPDPLAPLPALIAAAVHFADMAEYHRKSGLYLGSSRRVAVVTNDYHARGVYRGLGVRHPQRGGGIAPLRDAVPAATLGGDGVIRVLGSPTNGWCTAFVPSVDGLRSLREVDLAVVVPPAGDVRQALALGIPTIVVAADPSDPAVTTLDGETLTFGWDRTDIARAAEYGGLPARLARRMAGGTCEVVAVPAHTVCENAALFWQDVGPLVRSGGRSSVARALAREAWSLFHDLSGLALPVAEYEAATAPIRIRLDAVAAATRLTRGDTRDLYLPMVEAELRDLANALGMDPPKRDALLHTLGDLLDEHEDVMLVARTAEMARLHRADLADRGTLARVRVTSLGALADEQPADVALLTGMAPTWARWVYRAGIATSLCVLAYTPEGEVESVSAGYDEVTLVRRTIALQTAREEWIARPARKDRTWSRLSGDARLVSPDGDEAPAPRGDVSTVPVSVSAPPDVPPGLWDGDGWLARIEPSVSDGEGPRERDEIARSGSSIVEAVTVHFEDGQWTLMDLGGTVTRFKPGSGTPDLATPVSAIKPGDRLILFDGDGRKDLLAKVIEVAVEVPALAVAAGWVAHWRRVLVDAYRHFGSYPAFAAALAAQGCRVQTQTVRLWVVGATIGPDDDEDVCRVGIVMNDQVLRDNHQEVCRGIRSLRGAHIRLGQRLAAMAVSVGSAAAAGRLDADEVVDERSGLTVADFRESVGVVAVASVEPAGSVPYLLIGRLSEEDDIAEGED